MITKQFSYEHKKPLSVGVTYLQGLLIIKEKLLIL